jgi:hypothetical protein
MIDSKFYSVISFLMAISIDSTKNNGDSLLNSKTSDSKNLELESQNQEGFNSHSSDGVIESLKESGFDNRDYNSIPWL